MHALTNGHASNSFLVISSIYNSPHRPIEAFLKIPPGLFLGLLCGTFS
jgi:hypothetical protein